MFVGQNVIHWKNGCIESYSSVQLLLSTILHKASLRIDYPRKVTADIIDSITDIDTKNCNRTDVVLTSSSTDTVCKLQKG